jgi:rhodanese-related sulfurtransferase
MSIFFDVRMEIEPAEVHRRMAAGEMMLIDVREDYEWEAGHVPDSRHVELSQLGSQAATVPTDKPVAFICLMGARSGMVAASFRRAGYDAYNVTGGFAAWFDAGLPTEPEGASVADH